MLQAIRSQFTQSLWENYLLHSHPMQQIQHGFKQKNLLLPPLDHFAVIDLPSPNTGIAPMSSIFSMLGYKLQGRGYLPEKQNDFAWLTAEDSHVLPASDALPQAVVADFRLDELPTEIRKIIVHYANQSSAPPFSRMEKLIETIYQNDSIAEAALIVLLMDYFKGRDWHIPTVRDFKQVQEFNELLAWVLVFGRKPNHFTLSAHLSPAFTDLEHFNTFIEEDIHLALNQEGGKIKGDSQSGIAQSSTAPYTQTINLADGQVDITTDFVEFAWRFPRKEVTQKTVILWRDYFTGFVAQHANHVIESLYLPDETILVSEPF